MSRGRLTRRGWIALLIAGALAVTGTYVGYRIVFGGHNCEVSIGGRTVELRRGEAERASAAVASMPPRSIASATREVERTTAISGADARLVATALTGRRAAVLTCRGGGGDSAPDELDDNGLTARAERVRGDMAEHFGALSLGGFEPGGVHSGHMPGSAHYEGRAIDVFFRPIKAANKRAGWALAQYLVVNAERLKIATVIFDGRIWTAARSFQGWRDYRVSASGRSAATVRILEHRDHVHVDVAD